MIPVSMRGEGVRSLWDNAETRIREENAERQEKGRSILNDKAIENIYKQEAQNAVDDIRARMAVRAQTLIGKTTATVPRVVILSQAQYDGLPAGTKYTLNGINGTKK